MVKSATLSLFKVMATLTHDNRESAMKEWGRTWGMSWWCSLWAYREYTLGHLVYRTGKVNTRHSGYQHTEFLIKGNEVGKTAFIKEYAKLLSEGIVLAPKSAPVVATAPAYQQLSLF